MIKFINIIKDDFEEIFEPYVDSYEIGGISACLEKLLQENDCIVFYSTKNKKDK